MPLLKIVRPLLGACLVLPIIQGLAAQRIDAVEDDVQMGVRGIAVSGENRLVVLPAHREQEIIGGGDHMLATGAP